MAGSPASQASPAEMVRSGLSSRQTGPSSSEAGTSPTQNQTYTQVGAGLAPLLLGPRVATSTVATAISRPRARSPTRVARASAKRCSASGSGRPSPAAPSSRGVRQNMPRTAKEITRAATAPYWASHSGTGRSLRPPMPWARIVPGAHWTWSSNSLSAASSSSTSKTPGASAVNSMTAGSPGATSFLRS